MSTLSKAKGNMNIAIVYILISVVGGAAGQVLLKKGMSRRPIDMTIRQPLTGRRKKMVKSFPAPIMVVRKYFSERGPRIIPRINGGMGSSYRRMK